MTPWIIRQASLEDLEAIMVLEQRGFPPGIVEEPEVFHARLEVFPEGFLLLESRESREALGYLTGELWNRKDAMQEYPFALNHDLKTVHDPQGNLLYIASMTLDPGVRGKGLGRDFFRSSLRTLLGNFSQVDELMLIVGESWKGACKIYQSCGFQEIGRLVGFLAPSGAPREDVLVMSCPRGELQL